MKKYASWKVAAAILAISNKSLHYQTITKRVISSKLSGLGDNANTPDLTMHRVMNSDHSEVFTSEGRCCINNVTYSPKIAAFPGMIGEGVVKNTEKHQKTYTDK